VPRAGKAYGSGRNQDRGPGSRQAVSGLSPWIRHRLVTETEVLQAVLALHAPAAAAKFIEEVCWRGYFKGYLEARPSIWADYRRALQGLRANLRRQASLAQAHATATEGRTGIDCFDAWVAELRETGYLHNHARMCLASIWIFTLKLPWQLGADFTLRHFIDGDPASNTLGWRWVAGLHTRGKHYLARAETIAACSGGRFAPQGLATVAESLTESATHAAQSLPAAAAAPPEGRFALLLTEEDLHPESLGIDPRQVIGVAGATALSSRSPSPVSPQVQSFTTAAMEDALLRAAACYGCDTQRLRGLDGDSIAEWAEGIGASVVLTPYVPVGPVEESIADAAHWLAMRGLKLVMLRRHYDAMLWPHATRGFFDLRDRIPAIIAGLGLQTGRPQQGELAL
jgi:deoxyribodipyrimidine photo-lyase